VSWSPPRPATEFFHRFGTPRSSQLLARLKNNVYYYRTNYVLILAAAFALCFLRNPLALPAGIGAGPGYCGCVL
jgi:hypothetical protein